MSSAEDGGRQHFRIYAYLLCARPFYSEQRNILGCPSRRLCQVPLSMSCRTALIMDVANSQKV